MQDEDQKEQTDQPDTGWKFTPGATSSNASDKNKAVPSEPGGSLLSWSASEYIGNPKNTSWFAMLAAGAVAVGVIVYLLTSDLVSVIVIAILAVTVGIFAARPPQVLEYSLDKIGIHRGQRFYPYDSFKTFSVLNDGAFSHIYLVPLKRFTPPLAVHYLPTDEDKIISIFADYLPHEEQKRDIIENFSRRVKF